MNARLPIPMLLSVMIALGACAEDAEREAGYEIIKVGQIEAPDLVEASGMQASFSTPGHFFLHNDNDNKARLFVIDGRGRHLARIKVKNARNRDWEDIASMPAASREDENRLLVIGDIGDNHSRHSSIDLYFVDEPAPDAKGRYPKEIKVRHRLSLTYPDGPRDTESMAWDPVGDRLMLLSKRDKPSRIYAIDRETALSAKDATLSYLGQARPFRPPTARDAQMYGKKQALWISQPTGMDISADGEELVVITYRSLYRFQRAAEENWETQLAGPVIEVIGPPSPQEEAVTFSVNGDEVYVTTERHPAPVYLVRVENEVDRGVAR